MPSQDKRIDETPREGVTVFGEAVRRVLPERAEFLFEITASAGTAAQALRDNQMKTAQVAQAITPLGVQPLDAVVVSLKVYNVYAPSIPALPAYGGVAQIGLTGLPQYVAAASMQPEVQVGSYYARSILRINVREAGRAGEIADAASRMGATMVGGFSFQPADDATARMNALEAAGKDARKKAETLAAAAGKQVGTPIAITEEVVATNGAYAALRATLPFAVAAGMPDIAGELEYYARVSATFRLQ